MRALSASELLNVWERWRDKTSIQQALGLLVAACPETSMDALAKFSIGKRDASLLTLRELAFGPQMVGLATCPNCSERLDLNFKVADIRVETNAEPTEELTISIADYEIHFRLPNSLDLSAFVDHKDTATARQQLLERCLFAAYHNGEKVSAEQLPTDVVGAIADRMGQVDQQADVQLALTCPSCGHRWQSTFDIVSFFWSEITAWAYRILHEVHTLALTYGWQEDDILAMSPWRRQFYLEMIGG